MRATTLVLPAVFAAALIAFGGTDSKDKAQPKQAVTTSKTTTSKTSTAKTPTTKATVTKTTATNATSKAPAPRTNVSLTSKSSSKATPKQTATSVRRSYQVQPTPERYREIQQALTEKGYFGGAADGNWGPESVDALKRFQHDQNLTEDGKIGSLSLIALGLGPKRDPAPIPTQQGSGIQ